jgi:hypothetical protein
MHSKVVSIRKKRRHLTTGRTFGFLTVTELLRDLKCKVKCRACGNQNKIVHRANLKRMNTCGCSHFKHGARASDHRDPAYVSYCNMRSRCENKKNNRYHVYGGANPSIKVCARWRDEVNGFKNFKADLGERPPGTSLGRFGDRGWYKPGNVAWMTQDEQVAERCKKFERKNQTLRLAA